MTYIKNQNPLTNLSDTVGNSVESFIFKPGNADEINPIFQSGALDASNNLVLTFSEVLGDLNYSLSNFELRILGVNKQIGDIDVDQDKLIIKHTQNNVITDLSAVYIKYVQNS